MKVKVTINVLAIFVVLFSASCEFRHQSEQKVTDSIDTAAFLKVGDSVTMLLQKILLENVMQATKAGGLSMLLNIVMKRQFRLPIQYQYSTIVVFKGYQTNLVIRLISHRQLICWY